MSKDTFEARNALDQSCVELNVAAGVDDCAEGPYCIDTESLPSRCVNLEESSTCLVGREKYSQICVYADSLGPNSYGVDYCKINYCMLNKGGKFICQRMQDEQMKRAK